MRHVGLFLFSSALALFSFSALVTRALSAGRTRRSLEPGARFDHPSPLIRALWCFRNSQHISTVIPANPGEGRGRAEIQLPERGQATFWKTKK